MRNDRPGPFCNAEGTVLANVYALIEGRQIY
jgi:hypothetical protein